jgi:Golgi nucleoside diphosphatase
MRGGAGNLSGIQERSENKEHPPCLTAARSGNKFDALRLYVAGKQKIS